LFRLTLTLLVPGLGAADHPNHPAALDDLAAAANLLD
jgi:hypothetical protein